jgi:CBS domain-containing protein
MFVAEILKTKGNAVFSIAPERTVADACAALEERRVGALVVCDGDRVAGVFSERDVVRALAADGAAALNRPVADYMTAKVIFAEPKEEMSALMSRMTDRRIRHLPVLEGERLVGVNSIGDVVKCQIAEHAQEADSLRSYIAG